MKKIIILKRSSIKHLVLSLFVWTFTLPAIARNENDTIFYREKNSMKSYIIKENKILKSQKYFSSFFLDLGYNRLDKRNMFTGSEHKSAADFPKLRNSVSRSFAMHAMFGLKISRTLSIMSGLGIEWVNYRFSKEVTIREIDGIATQVPIESFIDNFSYMKKSKLTGTYLNLPILLKIHLHRRFFIAAGVTGSLNTGSHTNVVFVNTHGNKQTYKDYDIHLNTFRYGYVVRAGFRHLSMYVNYYVSPLFAKNEGPQVYPFVMGISLNLW
jgi:hypothetical protein